MCGVVGWVDFERDLRGEDALIGAMTDTLACRGPDGAGIWVTAHAALGHRRMSVIDLDGGAQPMVAEEDGRPLAAITYCSEVYNYRELRRELTGRGHRFRTASDTEVVLRAYLEWGEGCADRLNGIFAFGVWDARSEELLLVRDRLGVKPLYYHRTPHGVVFGSEPKALLAHPAVAPVVDDDGLRELLSLAKTPGHGVYRDVHEVRPGELLRVSRTGVTARRYWRLEGREHTDDLPTTVATVRGLLEEIVSAQLVADVPMGMLLSGGLDSSIIAAMAAARLRAQGAGPLRSFSLDFEGYTDNFQADFMRDAPDAPFVREMVRHIGADHTDVVLSTAALMDPAHRDAVLAAHDLPFARGDRDTALHLLCRAVRAECPMALTGESADEVFGGYRWFHDPETVRAGTFPYLAMFGHPTDDGPDSASSLLDPVLLKRLDLPGHRAAAYRDALADVPYGDLTDPHERRMRELCHLALTRLLPLLLDRSDRMSMSVGLEMRVPFLDHRLVEYVYGTPWHMKAYDGREKSLLRAATRDLLPASIAERRKAPFPATQDLTYERALRAELAALLDRGADAPVAPLLNRERALDVLAAPVGDISLNEPRSTVELVLQLNRWLERRDVVLDLEGR